MPYLSTKYDKIPFIRFFVRSLTDKETKQTIKQANLQQDKHNIPRSADVII